MYKILHQRFFSKIPHLPLNLILQVHRGQNKSYDPNFNNPDFGLHRIGPYQRLFRRRSCERKEMGELAGSFSRASAWKNGRKESAAQVGAPHGGADQLDKLLAVSLLQKCLGVTLCEKLLKQVLFWLVILLIHAPFVPLYSSKMHPANANL